MLARFIGLLLDTTIFVYHNDFYSSLSVSKPDSWNNIPESIEKLLFHIKLKLGANEDSG